MAERPGRNNAAVVGAGVSEERQSAHPQLLAQQADGDDHCIC